MPHRHTKCQCDRISRPDLSLAPSQERPSVSNMAGILARASRRSPSIACTPPSQISPVTGSLRKGTGFCTHSNGQSSGFSPDFLISRTCSGTEQLCGGRHAAYLIVRVIESANRQILCTRRSRCVFCGSIVKRYTLRQTNCVQKTPTPPLRV